MCYDAGGTLALVNKMHTFKILNKNHVRICRKFA